VPDLNVTVAARALLAALAVAAAYSVRRVAGFEQVSPHAAAALLLWAASIGLAAAACRGPHTASTAGSGHRWTRTDGAIALGIVGLALALRTHALVERPLLGGDEAGWGVFARGIASGGGNPFGFGWYGWPALGEYVTALSLRVQGATIEGLRLPSALAGTLTAAIVWAYGVRTMGRFGGVVAGLVAATTILHVHLSRQGFQNVFDGLFAIVALAALERAWSERRRDLFILAGAALAIAQHFYASAHALPIIVLAWIALRFMLEGRRAAERWRDLAAMAFVFAVAAWPQLTLALEHPADWLAPMSRQIQALPAGTEAASPLAFAMAMLARVRDASLAFVAVDMRGSFTPAAPLLPPLAAAAFVVGLVDVARRWREPVAQLLALWIASVVAIGALSEFTPAGQRYPMAVPAAALVAALGASWLVRAASRLGSRAGVVMAALVLVALAAEGAVQAERYFVRSPPWVGARRDVNGEIALDLAARIGAAPPGARVVMLGAPRMWYRGFHQLRYLRPATVARDVEPAETAGPATAAGCGVVPIGGAGVGPAVDCLVVVLPHREADLDAIRAAVTVLRESAVSAADGLALYRLVEGCGACGPPGAGASPGASPPAVSSTR
jgi:4-amino-4-deoxy-L-arabinose transferase-like glycosyltransferase